MYDPAPEDDGDLPFQFLHIRCPACNKCNHILRPHPPGQETHVRIDDIPPADVEILETLFPIVCDECHNHIHLRITKVAMIIVLPPTDELDVQAH